MAAGAAPDLRLSAASACSTTCSRSKAGDRRGPTARSQWLRCGGTPIATVGPDRYAAWVAREDFRLAARQSASTSSTVSPAGVGTVAAASASASAGGG